jgi:Right handed beta helix region
MYSQPGIFNVLDYGMVPNKSDALTAENNALALQATIDAAQAFCNSPSGQPCGAIILIPSNDTVPIEGSPGSDGEGGVYYIAVPSALPSLAAAVTITCPCPLLLLGTGNGTLLMMVENSNSEYGHVFSIEINDMNNIEINDMNNIDIGGLSFQDFQIQYAQGATSVLSTAAALHLKTARNVRLFRMILIDCPIGAALENSLQFSMIDCEVQNNLNSGTAVSFGNSPSSAKEVYIAGCIFEAVGEAYGTGTCLLFLEADEVRVVNTRIDSFQQGILMSATAAVLHLFFENVSVFTAALAEASEYVAAPALVIAPQIGASVTQATFVGCEFSPVAGGAGINEGPGISIDTGSGGIIDQIRFVSCYSCTWPGAGMQINGGTNIEVLGGYYSCNGGATPSPPTSVSAGIAITAESGDVTGVRIVGAACNNSIYKALESLPGPEIPTQQDGIYIENESWAISNVLIDSCDLSGNLSYGIGVAATATSEGPGVADLFIRACNLTSNGAGALDVTGTATIEVTDCAGYNDQATVIWTVAPASSATIANYIYGYYGPVAFYVTGNANATVHSITIDGHTTALVSGGFTLGPGEFASIGWTTMVPGSSPNFLMVGK